MWTQKDLANDREPDRGQLGQSLTQVSSRLPFLPETSAEPIDPILGEGTQKVSGWVRSSQAGTKVNFVPGMTLPTPI